MTVTLLPLRFWRIFLNIAFQSSFSTSKTNLFTGWSKLDVSLIVEFVLPFINWTLRTSASSSLYVFSILPIGYLFRIISSCTKKIFPTLKFCLVWLHFCLAWSVANTFFVHRVQSSFDKCWARENYFLHYIPCFWKLPGSGITTVVFELSICNELNGIIMLKSPMDWQVINRELIIPSASTNNVRRYWSLILSPWFLSNVERILLADWTCGFYTLPLFLAIRGLRFQLIHSPPNSIKKLLILFHPSRKIPSSAQCLHQ